MSFKSLNFRYEFIKLLILFIIPTLIFISYDFDIIPIQFVYLVSSGYIFTFLILPVIFKFNYSFQRNVVFLHKVNIPPFAEFQKPKRYGLYATRNFYLKTKDNILLGIWHILPDDLINDDQVINDEKEYYEQSFQNSHPVIVYCHGNSSNRAAAHHVELYKVLRKNYHVVTFDYRGYGDSTGCPDTELLVVGDTITIVQWVRALTNAPIYIWGHSIGTGIATYASRILEHEMEYKVNGLVLENPFDNLRNEISEHPLTLIYKLFPWFSYMLVEPIGKSGFLFQSDEHINHVSCNILLLHSEDDMVVPYKLGLELYNIALKNRSKDKGPIKFQGFEEKFGYGHKYICRAPELPKLIQDFMEQCSIK